MAYSSEATKEPPKPTLGSILGPQAGHKEVQDIERRDRPIGLFKGRLTALVLLL